MRSASLVARLWRAAPDGTVIVRSSAGAISYETANQQHTALEAISAATLAVTRRYFDPYGSPAGTRPSSWPDVGRPADPATSLDLFGARQYDPATGAFLSPDPIFQPGTLSMGGYNYAAGNPATNSDPSGLYRICYADCNPQPSPGNGGGGGSGGGGGGYDPYAPWAPSYHPAPALTAAPRSAPAARPAPHEAEYSQPAAGYNPAACGRFALGCGGAPSAQRGGGDPFALLKHLRMPDYVTISFSISPAVLGVPVPPVVLISGSLTITKHGSLYGGIGGGVGVPGWQASARAGWIDTLKAPDARQINSFVQGSSITGDVFDPEWGLPEMLGVGPSVAETWGYPGSFSHLSNLSTEIGGGLGTMQNASLMYSYNWSLGRL